MLLAQYKHEIYIIPAQLVIEHERRGVKKRA